MIYYFSGTGNSRYAAEKTAILTGDKCVNIADIYNGEVTSVVGKANVTGFVFPVYFSGIPEMVKRFITNPEIRNNLGEYVFVIMTYGGAAAGAGKMFADLLGREPDLTAGVKMPDNSVIVYDPATNDEAIEILKAADARLSGIADRIINREKYSKAVNGRERALTAFMYPLYGLFRTTLFFRADSKCVGCGVCVSACPEKAIEMKGGKPSWNGKRCQHCTACINLCPKDAIQFGLLTGRPGRYHITKLR